MSPKVKWSIVGGAVALVVFALFFLTREPPPPYEFLTKYPVVERRESADGNRYVVVKGRMEDVARDAELEIKPTFIGSSMSSVNGVTQQSRSYGTPTGQVIVSTDLSGGNFQKQPFIGPNTTSELRDGYCAVSYDRPKSLMDKAFDWVRSLFGAKREPPPPQNSLNWHVRM